jgi:excalibur calcium-binding domain-containing protein
MGLPGSATLIGLAVAAGLVFGPVPVVDAAAPVTVTAAVASTFGPAAPSAQPVAKKYKNCTALHHKYKHGIGKKGARDHTSSGDPVTNFKRSNALYSKNRHLDRDHDKIACEQH